MHLFGTSRCDVPAGASAGGTNVELRLLFAVHCAAERGADGAARHPFQQIQMRLTWRFAPVLRTSALRNA